MNVIEPNQNVIMNETKNVSAKNVCENIGNKKSWKRSCPKCKKILTYTNYLSFNQINKKNSLCSSCCQLGKGHLQTQKHKEYMSSILKGRKITWKDKIKNNHWSKNPKLRKKIIEDQSKLICRLIKQGILNRKNKAFKSGYFKNKFTNRKEFYRSSYELIRMNELNQDKNISFWTTKHGIKIPYYIDNIRHFYLPDFKIIQQNGKITIEETKGYIENLDTFKLKVKAAKKYCRNKNYKYVINYGNKNTKRRN